MAILRFLFLILLLVLLLILWVCVLAIHLISSVMVMVGKLFAKKAIERVQGNRELAITNTRSASNKAIKLLILFITGLEWIIVQLTKFAGYITELAKKTLLL